MNAQFFVLAFTAALNPKLLAIDLLLIENRRPRAMFATILAGGMSLAIAIGLVDVLVVQAGTVNTQKSVSAGVDLAIGVILLALGVLLLLNFLPVRRKAASAKTEKEKGDSWATRALREPRLLLAFGIGTLIGLPGAAYLTALHNLITGHYSTGAQVVAVIVFVIIEFLLIIVPWLMLELWPERTAALLRGAQAWFTSHAKQLMAWICVILGVYLTISALTRLL